MVVGTHLINLIMEVRSVTLEWSLANILALGAPS